MADRHERRRLALYIVDVAVLREVGHFVGEVLRGRVTGCDCALDVAEDEDRGVGAPAESAGEERRSQEGAVDGLVD